MDYQPDGRELLAIARRTLLDELLPCLPPGHRYAALMVANAMAIAGREWLVGGAREEESRRLLSALYEEMGQPAGNANEADLAALLRARAVPSSAEPALLDAMQAFTQARLAVSNPKYSPGSAGSGQRG